MKRITLYESDFAVNSFAYHEICDCFDILPDFETGEYPETIVITCSDAQVYNVRSATTI